MPRRFLSPFLVCGRRRDEDARADSLAALTSAHGLLQSRIASELSLKRTPRLEFVYDPTTDRALRVESLMRESG